MRHTLTTLLLFCCMGCLWGQSYNTAVGLRIGTGVGLSAVQRVADKTTVEGILNSKFGSSSVKITVLGRQHFPILFKRFNVYAGGGFHKTWYTGTDSIALNTPNPFGISFVAGGEISIGRLNVSYDYKPAFNIQGGARVIESETALTVRYVMWKRPTKMQKRRKARKKARAKKKREKDKKKDDGGGFFDKIFKRG